MRSTKYLSFVLLLACTNVLAHRSDVKELAIQPLAYVEGNACFVEGALWSPNGARKNSKLELHLSDGRILEAKTDSDGVYTKAIPYTSKVLVKEVVPHAFATNPTVICAKALVNVGPIEALDRDEQGQLGAYERPVGVDGCVAYLQSFPKNSIKLAIVNGHQALLENDPNNGFRVNLSSAISWCRYGVNIIRVDTWPAKEGGL